MPKLTEKDIKERIDSSIKPRNKKIGNEIREVVCGKVTRNDIIDFLNIKKPGKEGKRKSVSDFFDSLDPKAISEETKNKILDDLESYG